MHNLRIFPEKINAFMVKEGHGLDTVVQHVCKMRTEHVWRARARRSAANPTVITYFRMLLSFGGFSRRCCVRRKDLKTARIAAEIWLWLGALRVACVWRNGGKQCLKSRLRVLRVA